MNYAIMSLDSANFVDAYESKDAALAAVLGAVEEFGPQCADDWALLELEPDGAFQRVARGADLVELARTRVSV